ncbi:MAG: hypothetical protein IJZ00_05730 [Lachnospiraceae bacterium]|nr:hypothetical protein [Lachnospiraceae bacterium]
MKKIELPNYITGEYAVGTECFTITDNARSEVLGPGTGPRKIAVRMYYPTNKSNVAGLERADILSERKANALAKAYYMKIKDTSLFKGDYYEHVPHAENQKFPLIIFNHGYNAYIECNTFLCCQLASTGYIVASVGHAYEAVINEYDDGSYDLYDKKINKKMYDNMFKTLRDQKKLMKEQGSPEELFEKFDVFQKEHMAYILGRIPQWAEDTLQVVNALKTKYADWINFSNGIGATGHSLGGVTAYYLCHHSDDFVCGINIDGGVFGEYDGMIMKKPFLQICCKENYNVVTRALMASEAPVQCEIFEDMKHLGFTDAKFYIPFKSLAGKMPPLEMHERLSTLHLEFFEKYLKTAN